MKTPSPRLLVASLAALLLLTACGGTSTSTWTIAPLQPTPTPGPQGSAVASAKASAMPTASAASSAAPASAAASAAPSAAPASAAVSPAASRTVSLQLTGMLTITDTDGNTVTNLDVREGETIHFVLDNTAGFTHDFFIGPPDALAQNQVDGLPGIPVWESGVQEFDYVVTADTANLQFACTVPGHYTPMHGTFTLVP